MRVTLIVNEIKLPMSVSTSTSPKITQTLSHQKHHQIMHIIIQGILTHRGVPISTEIQIQPGLPVVMTTWKVHNKKKMILV